MRVLELWRYPVKSLQGERVEAARVEREGLEGDRRFAIYDVDTGLGLTARRVPELLFASARLREDDGVEITLPDGSVAADDDALSDWLGRPVQLRERDAQAARRYENPVVDFERETERDWELFEGASGAFHDSPGARVSLMTQATIGSWERRRFRSNVLLDGEGEDELVGSQVTLGDAVIDVGMRIERCVMVTRAQPDGIDRDLQVLRTIARERDARLAIGGLVTQPGRVAVGDALTVS